MFNNLIFKLSVCVNFSVWVSAFYVVSKRKYFHFLAHLSRRHTGEVIEIHGSGVPPSVRCPSSTFSNIFSSETPWLIKAKFYVEPPWEGGTKVYINGPVHINKMAATPIYGKNPSKIFFSRTSGPIFTKLGM